MVRKIAEYLGNAVKQAPAKPERTETTRGSGVSRTGAKEKVGLFIWRGGEHMARIM